MIVCSWFAVYNVYHHAGEKHRATNTLQRNPFQIALPSIMIKIMVSRVVCQVYRNYAVIIVIRQDTRVLTCYYI